MTLGTKRPAAAATGRGSINKGINTMHLPHERRNRRESAVACANPMADDAAGASHAAGWLAGHFGMHPSLAFLETEIADLEETR